MDWTRHELNKDFRWKPRGGPYRRITEEQARAYDEQGFFVLEDAFDPVTMEEVVAEIDPMEEQTEAFLQTQTDGRLYIARAGEITFSPHLVARSPRLREFCSDAVFRDLAHDLIGPNVRLYWDQSVYKKPGTEDPFPWHQDNGYTFVDPQQYLTCWVALTDTDEANGCPWVLPGVHRLGTVHHQQSDLGWVCAKDPADAVAAPVRAGGIVVFSSLTPHATGPNRTGDVRKSYIVQFAPDGAAILTRDEEGEIVRTTMDDPARNFSVVVDGNAPGAAED